MVFIDYVTLMLMNMAAGMLVLGAFLLFGAGSVAWASAFAVSGLVALVTGLHMCFAWPLPGAFNSAFGESSALLGAVFLGIALALWRGWSLAPMGVYILVVSLTALVLGARILDLGMTLSPRLSGAGFILSGLGGILTALAFLVAGSRALRGAAAVVLTLAALIWLVTALGAYWSHMKSFSAWQPPQAQSGSEK